MVLSDHFSNQAPEKMDSSDENGLQEDAEFDEEDVGDSEEEGEDSSDSEEEDDGSDEEGDNEYHDAVLEEDDSCPICLNEFSGQQIGVPNACDHTFCVDCILEWTKNSNSCPVDRKKVESVSVFQKFAGLFLRQVAIANVEELVVEEDFICCQICGSGDHEDTLLLCDGCDQGYHCACLTPALDEVPHGEWFCPVCRPTQENQDAESTQMEENTRTLGRTMATERVRAQVSQRRLQHSRAGGLDEQINAIVSDILTRAGSRFQVVEELPSESQRTHARSSRRKPSRSKSRKRRSGSKRSRSRRRRKRRVPSKKQRCRGKKHPEGRSSRSAPAKSAASGLPFCLGQTLSLMRGEAELDEYLSRDAEDTPGYLIAQKHRQLTRSALRFNTPLPSMLSLGSQIAAAQRPPPAPEPVPDLLGSILSGQQVLMTPSSNICIQRGGSLRVKKEPQTPSSQTSPADSPRKSPIPNGRPSRRDFVSERPKPEIKQEKCSARQSAITPGKDNSRNSKVSSRGESSSGAKQSQQKSSTHKQSNSHTSSNNVSPDSSLVNSLFKPDDMPEFVHHDVDWRDKTNRGKSDDKNGATDSKQTAKKKFTLNRFNLMKNQSSSRETPPDLIDAQGSVKPRKIQIKKIKTLPNQPGELKFEAEQEEKAPQDEVYDPFEPTEDDDDFLVESSSKKDSCQEAQDEDIYDPFEPTISDEEPEEKEEDNNEKENNNDKDDSHPIFVKRSSFLPDSSSKSQDKSQVEDGAPDSVSGKTDSPKESKNSSLPESPSRSLEAGVDLTDFDIDEMLEGNLDAASSVIKKVKKTSSQSSHEVDMFAESDVSAALPEEEQDSNKPSDSKGGGASWRQKVRLMSQGAEDVVKLPGFKSGLDAKAAVQFKKRKKAKSNDDLATELVDHVGVLMEKEGQNASANVSEEKGAAKEVNSDSKEDKNPAEIDLELSMADIETALHKSPKENADVSKESVKESKRRGRKQEKEKGEKSRSSSHSRKDKHPRTPSRSRSRSRRKERKSKKKQPDQSRSRSRCSRSHSPSKMRKSRSLSRHRTQKDDRRRNDDSHSRSRKKDIRSRSRSRRRSRSKNRSEAGHVEKSRKRSKEKPAKSSESPAKSRHKDGEEETSSWKPRKRKVEVKKTSRHRDPSVEDISLVYPSSQHSPSRLESKESDFIENERKPEVTQKKHSKKHKEKREQSLESGEIFEDHRMLSDIELYDDDDASTKEKNKKKKKEKSKRDLSPIISEKGKKKEKGRKNETEYELLDVYFEHDDDGRKRRQTEKEYEKVKHKDHKKKEKSHKKHESIKEDDFLELFNVEQEAPMENEQEHKKTKRKKKKHDRDISDISDIDDRVRVKSPQPTSKKKKKKRVSLLSEAEKEESEVEYVKRQKHGKKRKHRSPSPVVSEEAAQTSSLGPRKEKKKKQHRQKEIDKGFENLIYEVALEPKAKKKKKKADKEKSYEIRSTRDLEQSDGERVVRRKDVPGEHKKRESKRRSSRGRLDKEHYDDDVGYEVARDMDEDKMESNFDMRVVDSEDMENGEQEKQKKRKKKKHRHKYEDVESSHADLTRMLSSHELDPEEQTCLSPLKTPVSVENEVAEGVAQEVVMITGNMDTTQEFTDETTQESIEDTSQESIDKLRLYLAPQQKPSQVECHMTVDMSSSQDLSQASTASDITQSPHPELKIIVKENDLYSPPSTLSMHSEDNLRSPSPISPSLLSPKSSNFPLISSSSQEIEESLSYAEEFLEQSRKRWHERKKGPPNISSVSLVKSVEIPGLDMTEKNDVVDTAAQVYFVQEEAKSPQLKTGALSEQTHEAMGHISTAVHDDNNFNDTDSRQDLQSQSTENASSAPSSPAVEDIFAESPDVKPELSMMQRQDTSVDLAELMDTHSNKTEPISANKILIPPCVVINEASGKQAIQQRDESAQSVEKHLEKNEQTYETNMTSEVKSEKSPRPRSEKERTSDSVSQSSEEPSRRRRSSSNHKSHRSDTSVKDSGRRQNGRSSRERTERRRSRDRRRSKSRDKREKARSRSPRRTSADTRQKSKRSPRRRSKSRSPQRDRRRKSPVRRQRSRSPDRSRRSRSRSKGKRSRERKNRSKSPITPIPLRKILQPSPPPFSAFRTVAQSTLFAARKKEVVPEPADTGPQPIATISGHSAGNSSQLPGLHHAMQDHHHDIGDEDDIPHEMMLSSCQPSALRTLVEVPSANLGGSPLPSQPPTEDRPTVSEANSNSTTSNNQTSSNTLAIESHEDVLSNDSKMNSLESLKQSRELNSSSSSVPDTSKPPVATKEIPGLSITNDKKKPKESEIYSPSDVLSSIDVNSPPSPSNDTESASALQLHEEQGNSVLNPTQILNFIGLNPQQKSAAQNAILSIAELSKHLQLGQIVKSEKKLKQSRKEADGLSPVSIDNIESSAVEMYNKDRESGLLRKMRFQERVVEEAKLAIKPYYERREISKTEYKEIMKRAVNKICASESNMEVNNVKIRRLIRRYIEKYQKKNAAKREKMRSKLDSKVGKVAKPRSPSPPPYQPLTPPHPSGRRDSEGAKLDTPSLLKREPRKIVTLPDLPLPPPPPPPIPKHMQ